MALITCPECNKQISDSASSCPNCGYQFTSEKIEAIKKAEQQKSERLRIGCLSMIAIFFILFLIGLFSSESPNNNSNISTTNNSNISTTSPEKSVWEQNQDLAREMDRMEKAQQLDRMEEERRAIDRYRQY